MMKVTQPGEMPGTEAEQESAAHHLQRSCIHGDLHSDKVVHLSMLKLLK